MVTIRAYSNQAEAAMAKSLLDSHDIFCRLADENVNLYGGGPLAMPVRLLVAEDQADEAARVLDTKRPELPGDFDPGTPVEIQTEKENTNDKILSQLRGLHHGNQWLVVMGATALAILLYLAFGTSHSADPWSRVQQAVRRHDYDHALSLTKQMIKEDPDDYNAHAYLGYVYSQMGNLDQAELEYSRAYDLATKELKERLEAVRKRRARQNQINVTPTSIPPQ